MAIVEMKRMRLLALKRDRARILEALQKLCCVHVDATGDAQEREQFAPDDSPRREETQGRIARLDWAIAKLAPFDPIKRPMFSGKEQRGEDDLLSAQASRGDAMEIVERLEKIETTLLQTRTKRAREQSEAEKLLPWRELDAPLERLGVTANSRSFLVSVPARAWEGFCAQAQALDVPPAIEEASRDGSVVNALVATHRAVAAQMDQIVRGAGGVEVAFEGMRGTPGLCLEQAYSRIKRLEEVERQLQGEVRSLGARAQELRLARDAMALESMRLEAAQRFLETSSAFYMTAWTPAACVQKVQKALDRCVSECAVEFADPEQDEQPPVELRNGSIASPFESVVKMYSLPDYRGLDPTAIMVPFFICYFGLMVSDAAYGVIMGLATAFLTWKLRGKGSMGSIIAVLLAGSVGTVIWGALLGGWFGIEDVKPLIGFTPMGDPIKMMVLCLGLGAVHILTGIGVAMYMNFRRGKVLDGLLDQGLWFVLFAGLGLLFVAPQVGKYVAIAGAAGIFFTAGRARKNLFSKLTGGFGALYGISGYVSDILSYARLFGMGLATGVIAMVFNNVAGMFMGSVVGTIAGIVVLVVGHVFNLGINVLGAYVHTCRLQYIEFFGKFYEDGGKPFEPLNREGKYVEFTANQDA